MSHFTVLVIGGNVEEQLAPYDESITVAPYRKYEHDTEWLFRAWAREHEGQQRPSLEEAIASYNRGLGEDEEYERVGIDDFGVFTMSTYNPDSRWDWWIIGGRWTGFFKLTAEALDRATSAVPRNPGGLRERADLRRRPDDPRRRRRRGDASARRRSCW